MKGMRIFYLLFLVGFAAVGYGQEEEFDIEFVTELKYDWVGSFSDGLAIILKNGKYGFVNESGEEIVAPVYDELEPFSDNFSPARLRKKWGFINRSGVEIIPFSYDNVSYFNGDLYAVCIGEKWKLINSFGENISSLNYDYIGDVNNGLAIYGRGELKGLIDDKGQEVTDAIYTQIGNNVDDFIEEPILTIYSGRYGYIDRHGKTVIPHTYSYSANTFSDGKASISSNERDEFGMPEKYYIINRKGKILSTWDYRIEKVLGEYMLVYRDYPSTLLSLYRNEECIYPNIGHPSGNIVYSEKKKAHKYYDGKPFEFFYIFPTSSETIFLGESGQLFRLPKSHYLKGYSENVMLIQSYVDDHYYYYTDMHSNRITDLSFKDATIFSNGYAAVKLNNKWAIIKKVPRKKMHFRIEWNQPTSNLTVTDATYTIQATVHSSSTIQSIRHEVRGQRLDPVRWQPNRKIQTYSKDIQLTPGKNIITIVAENAEGEIRSKPLTITYKAIPKIWSVVVGIERYEQITGLHYSADDAAKFDRFLASVEGGSVAQFQTILLTDEKATRERILTEIKRIGQRIRPNDSFYFFFSGHGEKGAFKPYDFSHDYPQSSLLTHADLVNAINQIDAKNKIIIADACFAGSIIETDFKSDNPIADFYDVLKNNSSGTAILASCRPDQKSQELRDYQQGIFSNYLFQGLNGKADNNRDKRITIQELFNYLEPKVRDDSNNFQRPVIGGRYDEETVIAIVR